MRIEVTNETLTYELLRIAKHHALPRAEVARRMGLKVLNTTGNYGKRSDVLARILDAVGCYLEVDGCTFDIGDPFFHIFTYASKRNIMPDEMVEEGIYTSKVYARHNWGKSPMLSSTWFIALEKLGYKVYLCN